MVSYEVAMGLTLIGTMMIYGSIRLDDMVRWQGEHAWGIFVQPLAFFLFFTAAVAETKRIPFDLPEAESELVSGYFTEYSGMKFGMFYFAEYMEVVTSSMLLVTIFLGGWELPFLHRDGVTIDSATRSSCTKSSRTSGWTIVSVLAFFGKVGAVCWFQAIIRWSLPRFRYDQLQKLGWRVLLPLVARQHARHGRRVPRDRPRRCRACGTALDVAAEVTQALIAAVDDVRRRQARDRILHEAPAPPARRRHRSAKQSPRRPAERPVTPMQA